MKHFLLFAAIIAILAIGCSVTDEISTRVPSLGIQGEQGLQGERGLQGEQGLQGEPGQSAPKTLVVDCTVPGESIENALQVARPGDTIQITGDCTDTAVTITMDDLTLEGIGGPIIDGLGPSRPVITVDGGQRVTIKDMRLRFGSNGIFATRGAGIVVSNVVVDQPAVAGVSIANNSNGQLTDVTVVLSGGTGILGSHNSLIVLNGTIISDRSGTSGISLELSSTAIISRGAIITAKDSAKNGIHVGANSTLGSFGAIINTMRNSGPGIGVSGGSSLVIGSNSTVISEGNRDGLAIWGASEAVVRGGSSLTTRQNSDHGIRIFSSQFELTNATMVSSNNAMFGIFVFESSEFDLGGDALVEGNGEDGIHLNRSAHLNARLDSDITIRNNVGNGVLVLNQSSVDLVQGLTTTIKGNGGFGLKASGNSRVGLRDFDILNNSLGGVEVDDSSLNINDSTIAGNGNGDISAFFGSRITLQNNVIGALPITCDSSVLSRGHTVC